MKEDGYRLGYRADIEGLRAIAILLVVGAHASVPGMAGGFVGVDIFFVLSGYLITSLLINEVSATGTLRFADFYVRRLRRLMPALLAMLLIAGGLAALLLSPSQQRGQSIAAAAAALWLSNFHFAFARLDYFAAGADFNIFLHTWSLGVEEQFYLLWPALIYLVFRAGNADTGLRRLKYSMWLVALFSFILSAWMTRAEPRMAFYMMPARAWQFAAGALVCLYRTPMQREPEGNKASRLHEAAVASGWLGLAMILGAGLVFNGSMPYPGWAALVPALGAALVIGAGDVPGGVSNILSLRFLQLTGRISYSWYLWHWPVLLLGRAVTGSDAASYRAASVALSLLLAIVSYRLVEAPIRRQSYWLGRRHMAVAISLGCMIAVNVVCIRWYNHAGKRLESPEQIRYARAHGDAPVIYSMGCDDWYLSDQVKICTFGSSNAAHTAVLIGDSIAGQWTPAALAAVDRSGWRLIVLTKSSCPMVDEPFFYARIGREYTECATWRKQALQYLAQLRPDIVLMGTVATNEFTRSQWVEGSARVFSALAPSVGHIYLLRGTPRLPFDGPDCLAQRDGGPGWLAGLKKCDVAWHDEHDDVVYRWLQDASRSFGNVSTIDMNDLICPAGWCSAERNGIVVFRDSQHMTATFAATLGPALAQRIGLPAKQAPSANGHDVAIH